MGALNATELAPAENYGRSKGFGPPPQREAMLRQIELASNA